MFLSFFFLFRHAFSEVPRPIALKLGHMVENCLNFIIQVQKFEFKYFSDLRYFEPFRGYSRSNLKVVKNRAEFWTFVSPSQILGGRPSKTYTDFITPDSRHIIWKKFCEDTPTSPEVIGANTLNFKVNFKFSGLNFFFWGGGLPSQFGCALAGLGQSVARVKISGRSTP